jgi:hypothetical protein
MMQQQILRLLGLLPMPVIIKSLNMQMATGLIAVLIIYAIIADMAAKRYVTTIEANAAAYNFRISAPFRQTGNPKSEDCHSTNIALGG